MIAGSIDLLSMRPARLHLRHAASLFTTALACAVIVGGIGPAWAAAEAKPAVMRPATNPAPLPPRGAAPIRQAQGTGGVLLGALVTGSIFAAILLLVDGDDTGPIVTSTTTSQ
jgi:hypothetical protein